MGQRSLIYEPQNKERVQKEDQMEALRKGERGINCFSPALAGAASVIMLFFCFRVYNQSVIS